VDFGESFRRWRELTFPQTEVNQWFGRNLNTLLEDESGEWQSLSNYNDDEGWSFVQIAEAVAAKYDIEITYPEKVSDGAE
jgi:hypothetical protein